MSIVTAPGFGKKHRVRRQAAYVVFRVLPDARKDEIKRAVEKMFEVKVEKVRVICVRGKAVSRMGHTGVRASWKKAYVRLRKAAI